MKERNREATSKRGGAATETTCFGVLGAPGSFSEEAALAFAQREGLAPEVWYLPDFDDVLCSLNDERIELGVLPVANTVGGLVRASFEAMGRYGFRPVGQISLEIRHALLVRSLEVHPQAVERVVSHPQAIAQCSAFLTRELPGREWVEWSDTASAARDLAEGRLDAGVAVIASSRAAKNYGLHVLQDGIQDDPRNETRFVIVRRLAP